jgi:hypothetical protein
MTFRKGLLLIVVLASVSSAVWGAHTAMIGGWRDGVAFGLRAEESLFDVYQGQFGVLGSTGSDLSFGGDNTLVLYGGFKIPLFNLPAGNPLFAGCGVVAYSTTNSAFGPYLNFQVENLAGNRPLFFEAGFDSIGSGRIQLNLGYKFLPGGNDE